jgi:hypothetical protein
LADSDESVGVGGEKKKEKSSDREYGYDCGSE